MAVALPDHTEKKEKGERRKMENRIRKLIAAILCFSMTFVMMAGVMGQQLYWKPEYPDYVPSGMPDFDQKQDGWFDPMSLPTKWTFCGPVSVANSLWWLDSEFEPGKVPPPAISDGFGLVSAYGQWDDHDVKNVEPLVNDLAGLMQTSPQTGTEVHDMKQGIDLYLTNKGMHNYFYTHLYKQPTFGEVEIEVEKCQDVVLLLGFWQYDPTPPGHWYRFGGHYVTVAGINSSTLQVALSDPYADTAEPPPHGQGMPGRVLPQPPHPHPPVPPDTVHNDALFVSQDMYWAAMGSPSPGGLWGFPDYNQYFPIPDLFYNFVNQNFPEEYLPDLGPYNPQLYVYTEVEYAVITSPWYAKGQYVDYAPSGMPDFSEKQDAWTNPIPPNVGSWSHCGPVAVANSFWWYDSKLEPNPVPPPIINDGFGLVQSYSSGVWDDHDPQNVVPLVQDIAWYMDTDGKRTHLAHCGTDVYDMQAGIAQYMSDKGVNPKGDCNGDGVVNGIDVNIVQAAFGSVPGSPKWDLRADVVHNNVINVQDAQLVALHYGEQWGKFYEKTMRMPEFGYIANQIKVCEDVVLLLGVWQDMGGYFTRIGGHYVTAHGVDEADMIIAISDPFQDNAEQGGQGRVIPPSPHGHPPPGPGIVDPIHNDAMFVSHDYYTLGQSPSPGGHWGITDYNWISLIENVYGQNFVRNDTYTPEPWMGFPVFVEIEYAVVVSCRGPTIAAGSNDGNVYALDMAGSLLWTFNTQAPVVSVAMDENGTYVVAGSLNNGLYVFNNSAGTLMWSKPIPISESYDGSFAGADSKTVGISADGSYIIAAAWDGLYLYDITGTQIWHFTGVQAPMETCARISADGKCIVSTDYNTNEVHYFWHLRDGNPGWQATDVTPIWTQLGAGSGLAWVAIDAVGRYVAFTSFNAFTPGRSIVGMYDKAGNPIWSWEFNKTGFVRIDMPWDGRSLIAVNDDPSDFDGTQAAYFSDMNNGVGDWQAGDGTPLWIYAPTPAAGTDDFYTTAISPNGNVIAAAPKTTNIYLLDNTGTPIQTISDGAIKTVDLTFTGEYGVAGTLEPVGGAIKFFMKTRNSIVWTYPVGGKVESVAIQKKYQCMEPFPRHDVDVSGIKRYTTSDGKVKFIICQGYTSMNISVTLSNHGDYGEWVFVSLYAYSSSNNTILLIGNALAYVTVGGNPTVAMNWTTTNVPYYGNYRLQATVGAVQNENHLADNEFIDSGFNVTGVGDITSKAFLVPDRDVKAPDVSLVSSKYGAKTGEALYDPNCDLNGDLRILAQDVSRISSLFGTHYP